jgi:hypothetical protein
MSLTTGIFKDGLGNSIEMPVAVDATGKLLAGAGGSTSDATAALQTTGNTALLEIGGVSDVSVPANQVAPATLKGLLRFLAGLLAKVIFASFRNTGISNTPIRIKATPGQIFGWNFVNLNSTIVYIKFFDVTAVTLGTTVPVKVLAIAPNSVEFVQNAESWQHNFGTAIWIASVTGIADNNTTAPTSAIYSEVYYV